MIVVGIDEVGRGCWAGPLVAGAVILPPQFQPVSHLEDGPIEAVESVQSGPAKGLHKGLPQVRGGVVRGIELPVVLRDSKKMTKKQRDLAAVWVHANALAVGLGWVWPAELDSWGITTGVKRAMERALDQIGMDYDEVVIDGSINYFADNPKACAVIRADDSVLAVSAASIVAKVARDTYMTELGEQYVGYGFDKHVGYGTAAHIAALQALGVSDIHRRSYKPIKALLA